MLAGIKLYYQVAGLSGLLTGTLGTIVGYKRIMSVKPPQANHPTLLRVPSTDVATYQQIFQSEEYRFEVGRPPRTIVDAGANVGLASVYFANRYPEARIYAVEPETGNFQLLEKNVAQYPNVVAVHAALWDQDTEISLVDPGLGDSGFITRQSAENVQAPGRESHKIRGMTVSSLMAEFDIEHIDILKIDIEGAELEGLCTECHEGGSELY